ncbi:hypothetical protein QFZ66_001742 [Streptomyces sp. B4I13]|uniref:phosphotransferase n=1 Tax=Streptomyces sp. B4I13 TaxID=3042271 RepID=UPI0027873736|nr:phosphotransferase [Streptomyces sp. B4I13]MDQ0957864.1 hypothetical protein [Streptomyces sp. B4I13]
MTSTKTATVLFAGHRFRVVTDVTFDAQERYLRAFVPEHRLAPPCGEETTIRVRHDADCFQDRMARAAGAPSLTVVPFRGEPYHSCQLDQITWWQPSPDTHLPQDHLYARDAADRLTVLLKPGVERGERYLMRVVREVVLRCAESRGLTSFHAAAAALDDHGVLIAAPSGAGKTTVLTALAAHHGADSDRALITADANGVAGVPISVRIGGGTLSALAPREGLPNAHTLPDTFGSTRKAALNLDIEPRLLHHDLQPGHLLRVPEGPRLLLDWELAAFGDPMSDLARLAVRLRLLSPQPVLTHGPAPADQRRLELYWRLHLLADAALATDPEVRAHALALTTGTIT